jgi:hypothetical protein
LQFHVGGIPVDPSFDPSPPVWSRLREPKAGLFFALATVFAVVLALAFGGVWLALLRPRVPDSLTLNIDLAALALFLGVMAALIVVHEALHAIVLAGAGDGDVVIGVWPSRFVVYAGRFGEVGRARSLAVGLAPFVVLSVLPFALAPLVHGIAGWLAALSVLNAAGSAGDLIGVALIVIGTPRGAIIRNQGYDTWWRPPNQGIEQNAKR